MPQAKIRWKPGEKERISKEVCRFNEKIDRIAKTGNTDVILPEHLKTKDVKEMIYSRADYNAFLKLVNAAFEKDAFKLKPTQELSKFESREMDIRLGIINRANARTRELAGVSLPPENAIGSADQYRLAPKKRKTGKLRNKMVEELEKLRKKTTGDYEARYGAEYMNNYVKHVEEWFGAAEAAKVRKLLNKINPREFSTLKENNPELQISYAYDVSVGKVTGGINLIIRALQEILESKGHNVGKKAEPGTSEETSNLVFDLPE